MPVAGDLKLVEMLGLLAAGLALFLFGLQLLTDGLKAIAGARLPAVPAGMTSNRFKGVFAGAAITALLNSSTITTVLLVGFVSAGLMTLGQSVPVIMGANIGSTFTAQIIAFNVSALTPSMLASGFLGHTFGRREILRELGGAVLGLGLLGLQKARLETARLGELVLQATRHGLTAAIAGEADDLEAVRKDGTAIGHLASAILQYIGKLSEAEHTEEDTRELIKLIETVNDLESIGDVVAVNLTATGQERLAERADLASPRDESTSRLTALVTETLQETVASLGNANTANLTPIAARKAEMKSHAIAARKSVLNRLKLADVQDVLRFRLADDLIEQLRQIGRLTLRISENEHA